MPLNRFKLVNTSGLKGLNYKGDFIPFEAIDDQLAEQLMGKTHVLERLAPEGTAVAPVAIAETAEATAETEEAPAPTGRRARSN
jgi:hypothetical protein